MVARNPPWSDLPQELLSSIANKLTSNPICILSFRSICNSWRSSCLPLSHLLSPLLPLSVPRPYFYTYRYTRLGYHDCSFLSVTVIYAIHRPLGSSEVGSSSLAPNTWILFVDEFNAGKVSVRKPFSRGSYSIPFNFPKNVNLIDFNVLVLGRFHNLTRSAYYDDRGYQLKKPRFVSEEVDKVVLFPNGLAAIFLSDDGKLGMIRLNVGINKLGRCEVSQREIKHDGKGFRFDDIVEFKGRVLGIDRRGRVYEIGYHSSKMSPFVPPIVGGGGRRKRLVESLGSLYLVVRCNDDDDDLTKTEKRSGVKVHELNEERRKTKFKVYELSEGMKKWVQISSLGDRSVFFGIDFSFCASAQELDTCGKNCILFKDQSFRSYSGENDDGVVFSKSKSSYFNVGVCHLQDAGNFGAIESYPGYSDILWPPPPWIWSIDRLKRIKIVETAIEEILDRIPENFKTKIERAGDFCYDFRLQWALEAVRVVLELKEVVISFQEEETEFMHELGMSIDMLNQADIQFEQARSWILGTTEEIPGCLDKFPTCHAHRLRATMNKFRKRNILLFHIEERVTEVETIQKAKLVPILTR